MLPAARRQRWPSPNCSHFKYLQLQSSQTPAIACISHHCLTQYLTTFSYWWQRGKNQTKTNTKNPNPETHLYFVLAVKCIHFISGDQSSLRVYYRVFCPLGGGACYKTCAFKSHKSDVFCCCPVFSALITTKSPVEKNRGSLQRRELKKK